MAGELHLPPASCLRLVSAFLAMEPPDVLISLAKVCGGGSITERVQSFIWDNCIIKADEKCHQPYLKSFLKKLILEIESECINVLDEFYEQYVVYMTSVKDNIAANGNSKVLKQISFVFPDDCSEVSSCSKSRNLVVPLQCSLNMLEGDTGCSLWPSSLFLSEFILSHPEFFSSKSCFEVGSGVGLVGICLAHAKASKVVLTDGDWSSLANLKLNLELNQLGFGTDMERTAQDPNLPQVQCMHMPWESASDSELQALAPDIILGADVIYDPICIPHLIRVLVVLLNTKKSYSNYHGESCSDSRTSCRCLNDEAHRLNTCPSKAKCNGSAHAANPCHAFDQRPVAYVASIIRNIDTFNCFLTIARQSNLVVTDITEQIMKRFDLLSYMHSYKQSNVRLFIVSYCHW